MPFSYGCSEENLAHYTCFKTGQAINVNGLPLESAWQKAPRSNRFVDMVTGEPAFFDTFTSLLWDDEALYVAYWIQEPNVQAGLTERDSLIYTENDVEFFIAGQDCYYELEINALGTIYEALFIWQDALKKGSRFDVAEFELTERKVDLLGGFQDAFDHPRGARWAFRDWDFPGLQAAVHVDGTLNDSSDVDGGWTVELALPWKGMQWMADGRGVPLQINEQNDCMRQIGSISKTQQEELAWPLEFTTEGIWTISSRYWTAGGLDRTRTGLRRNLGGSSQKSSVRSSRFP
jgi:hypothetical protein